MLRSLIQ